MNFKSLFDFQNRFKTEADCLNFLKERRFPGGVRCLHCQSEKPYECADGLYKCRECKKRFSIRKGTIFDSSRLPLIKWFTAIYLINSSSKGISSLQLGKLLGITYSSAWFMAHRIREAYKQNKKQFLSGHVEIDEAYVGGKEKNKHADKKIPESQGGNNKQMVVGLVKRGNKKQVLAYHLRDSKPRAIVAMVEAKVKKGSELLTDESTAYKPLDKRYSRFTCNHSKGKYVVDGIVHNNNVENFWSIFKRGYVGVYHYMSAKHLQRYVNEYCFRYNNRKAAFSTMFCSVSRVLRYKDLVRG